MVLQGSQPSLTVRECLATYAGFYRAPRDIGETIALARLTEKAGALATRLSGGQQRRLDFALALIGDPELIFLDEPTTGFDPSARRAAWEVVAGLRRLGKTVFPTTHYMDEAEFVAVTALPHWLADVGEIFPVRHLANALLVAYNPHTTGLGFAGLDLLIVAAWGTAGLLIAVRKFSWLPLGR